MTIQTFVRFNDKKCREAMNFYKDCFGGELTFKTGGESPMAKDIPVELQDRIIEAHLKIDGFDFYGSDMFMDKATIGDNLSMRVKTDTKAEFDSLFEKLSDGGEVFFKPQSTSWGTVEGMVTDRYGIEWGLETRNA